MSDTIRLTIPATPPMLLVARMALAGFCSQCGSDTDTLEDVRTLSDEACYCLMHQQRPVQTLSIEAGMDGQTARIRFEAASGAGAAGAQAPHDPEIARGILLTLATEVRLSQEDGDVRAIEVAVRLGCA